MPFARFYKLESQQREQFMVAAAREFADHGFENSSVNRILERAHISKGRAYYYFEDKFDLFCTVMQYCIERLQLFDLDLDITSLTEVTFWPNIAHFRVQPLLRSFEEPWLFAATRAVNNLSPQVLKRAPLSILAEQVMTWLLKVIKRGQALQVIRTDVADDLIFAWVKAIDDANDNWLLAQWEELDREKITETSNRAVDALRRMLTPESSTKTNHTLYLPLNDSVEL